MKKLEPAALQVAARAGLLVGVLLTLTAISLNLVPGGQGEVFFFILGTLLILTIGGQFYLRNFMNEPFRGEREQ